MPQQLSDNVAIIYDDHPMVAEGLKKVLESHFKFGRVLVCSTAKQLRTLSRENLGKVSLILFDFLVPGEDPPALIREFRDKQPEIKLICVSASPSPADRQRALDAGASVFISKTSDASRMLSLIEKLLAGTLNSSDLDADPIAVLGLTPRQTEVLALLAQGQSNKEIARTLDISPETVKTHISELLRRTNSQNRMQIMNWARRRGFSTDH